MPTIATTAKREAATQAWSLWITSVTGEAPVIQRKADGVDIRWRPGQARKMENYLSQAMQTKEKDPNDLNVSVDLAPVLIPLTIKKTIGYVAAYTAAVVILTKVVWK
jgi:hypothetical protein